MIRQCVLAVGLFSVLCSGCSHSGTLIARPSKAFSIPGPITVYFNHRREGGYQSPITGQWRDGDNLEALLLNEINGAKREILIAVQELSRPTIAKALVTAQQRQVDVRVVLENNYSQPWSQQLASHLPKHQRQRWEQLNALADDNKDGITSADEAYRGDAIAILNRQRIPWIDDTEDGSRGSGLMHHKFVVIDQRVVITGSANFTASGLHGDANAPNTRGNVNHLLRIESGDLATVFRTEFMQLWGDGPGKKKTISSGSRKTAAVHL